MPFAYLGDEPLGPNCARKLGITKTALKSYKHGRLRIAVPLVTQRKADEPQTIDLFPELKNAV